MLTERDLAILRFINQFGFCEMPHLNQRFHMKRPRNYAILGKLIKKDMVIHEPAAYRCHGIYRLSKKGATFTDLPPIKKVPLGIYEHETLLIQLYFKMMEKYPGATWISERTLAHAQFCDGIGKKGHVPDALLLLPNKKVAIELELSLKGRRRIEKILRQYGLQVAIDEVWYFCNDSVLPTLTELANNKPYIHLFRTKEIFNAKP